jgi:hypothetical protein
MWCQKENLKEFICALKQVTVDTVQYISTCDPFVAQIMSPSYLQIPGCLMYGFNWASLEHMADFFTFGHTCMYACQLFLNIPCSQKLVHQDIDDLLVWHITSVNAPPVVSLCHHDGPSFCIPYNKLGLVLR